MSMRSASISKEHVKPYYTLWISKGSYRICFFNKNVIIAVYFYKKYTVH